MNENQSIPTQDELDACKTMQDKFKLKPPELFYELNEKSYIRILFTMLLGNNGCTTMANTGKKISAVSASNAR